MSSGIGNRKMAAAPVCCSNSCPEMCMEENICTWPPFAFTGSANTTTFLPRINICASETGLCEQQRLNSQGCHERRAPTSSGPYTARSGSFPLHIQPMLKNLSILCLFLLLFISARTFGSISISFVESFEAFNEA